MLDLIRNNRKIMLVILAIFIVPSFVFFGVSSYIGGRSSKDGVAKIGGNTIELAYFEEHMKRYPPSRYDTLDKKMQLLKLFVSSQLWRNVAHNHRLYISDVGLHRALIADEQLREQGVVDASGRIDGAAYKQLLLTNGLSAEYFESLKRDDEMVQRALYPLMLGFTSLEDARQYSKIVDSEYMVRVQRFDLQDYLGKVQITPEMKSEYYEQNQAAFKTPSFASVEYLVFDVENLADSIQVSDEEALAYYEKNIQKDLPAIKGQRLISHILVAADDEEKAQQVLAEVKKEPEQFAALAKEHSIDPSTADSGGDLGFFEANEDGVMKPLVDAAFALEKKGDVSDLIKTGFGYHIVRYTDGQESSNSFEDLKEGIKQELRAQLVNQQATKLAEQFAKGLEENKGSLNVVAEALNLPIQKSERVVSTLSADNPQALNHEALLNALFSDDSIANKINTGAIKISATQLMAARILEFTPEKVKPLAEVEGMIADILAKKQAFELAEKDSQTLLEAWKNDPEQAQSATQKTLSQAISERNITALQSGQLGEAAILSLLEDLSIAEQTFKYTAASKLPTPYLVRLPDRGYAVVLLEQIKFREQGEVDQAKLLQERAKQAATINMRAQEEAYINYLEKAYKVEISSDAMEKLNRS